MREIDSVAVPIHEDDIDSGRIFPSRFLRKPYSGNYADYLFHDERHDAAGRRHHAHVLDQPAYGGAGILVAGHNFGCGSSRESAVHALRDAGLRCVIAGSLGEIFEANCQRNGILAITLAGEDLDRLMAQLMRAPGSRVVVEIERQRVIFPEGDSAPFLVDAHWLAYFKAGSSELETAEQWLSRIEDFRRRYEERYPWLAGTRDAGRR